MEEFEYTLKCHNDKVRLIAEKLQNDGWIVKSGMLESYEKPGSIDGYSRCPDIVAEKNDIIRVVEVETINSFTEAKQELLSFAEITNSRTKIKFDIVYAEDN